MALEFWGPNSSLRDSILDCEVLLRANPAPDLTGTVFKNTGGLACSYFLAVSNVTFINCSWGAQEGPYTTFSNCTFLDCGLGLTLEEGTRTSQCTFRNCDAGIMGVTNGGYMNETVSNCTFDNCSPGIFTGYTKIMDCAFRNCDVGINVDNPSSISNCTFAGCNRSVYSRKAAEISGSTFRGDDGTGIQWEADHLNVTGCTFEFPNGTGINGTGPDLNISESTFNDSLQAVNLTADAGGTIRNCSFDMSMGQEVRDVPFLGLGGDFVLRDTSLTGGDGTLLSILSGDSQAINVTFPIGRTEVKPGASLEVGWYLDATVLYPNGTPAADANVRAEDRSGKIIRESPTGPDGRAPRIEAPEYLKEFDGTTYHTPYWINASKDGLARDLSVNVNQNLDLTLVLADVTPPWIQMLSPANGTLTNHSRVQFTGTAGDDIGVSSVRVRAVGGDWVPADGTSNWNAALNLSEGDHFVEAEAVDEAGNTALDSVRVSVDTLPPFLEITYPTRELLVNMTSIEITGRTEPGCTVRVDGEPVPFYMGQFSAEVGLQEGPNEITVTARDAAGNVNSSLVRVMCDTIPPDLTVTIPRDGDVTGQRILTVSGTAEEGARVLVDDLDAAISGPFFSASVTLIDGENLIIVQALDAAGNRALVALRVTLDTAPPFISVDLENGTITRSSEFLLAGEAEKGSALSVNGVAVDVGPDGRFRTNISLHPGLNTIHLVARDGAGNIVSLDRTVTSEQAPPPPKPAEEQPSQNSNAPVVLWVVVVLVAAGIAAALLFRRRPLASDRGADERPPAKAGGLHPIGDASLPPPEGGGLLSDEEEGPGKIGEEP
jgi:uncharacterized protein YjbI with pentapeptide repeats